MTVAASSSHLISPDMMLFYGYMRKLRGIQVSVPPKDTPSLLKGWAIPFRLLVVLCNDAYMQLYFPNALYTKNVVKHHLYDTIFY